MSEDKTSDRQRKSSVRRYMLQVTSTAIIKECCAFKYCTDRMLREAPAEIEGLRTLDDSQKSSNRMKLGVVSASMYACSTGRDVPAKNPWRAFFEPWPTRGREHPSRDAGRPCMHAHWEPKDPSDRGHAPARWISHSQKNVCRLLFGPSLDLRGRFQTRQKCCQDFCGPVPLQQWVRFGPRMPVKGLQNTPPILTNLAARSTWRLRGRHKVDKISRAQKKHRGQKKPGQVAISLSLLLKHQTVSVKMRCSQAAPQEIPLQQQKTDKANAQRERHASTMQDALQRC